MTRCHVIGIVVCLTATAGILYCLLSQYWDFQTTVSLVEANRTTESHQGLWIRCFRYVPDDFQCEEQEEKPFLGLPVSLKVQRAMMIAAMAFAAVGLMAGFLGQRFIPIFNGKIKVYFSRGGAVFITLASVLTLSTVSWYAAEVCRAGASTKEQSIVEMNFYLGAGIYVGWFASGLAFIGSGLLAFCNPSSEDKNQPMYKPGSTSPS